MLAFHEPYLRRDLEQFRPSARVAFAASCAQRLANAYRRFAEGQPPEYVTVFDEALDYSWRHILALPDAAEIEHLLADVMAQMPDEDAPGWTPLTPLAEDALAAVAYCLRCLRTGDAQEAVFAARRVYEAVDYFVTSKYEHPASGPVDEARVLADPAIQAELQRQSRDIAELRAAGGSLSSAVLDHFRQRSLAEQAIRG